MTPEQQKALAVASARRRRAESESPKSGILEQGMSGFNEGLAEMAGLPVDLATSGINAVTGKVNDLAGTNIGRIEDPIGGGKAMRRLFNPTISETEPQTGVQEFARGAGRELGAAAIPGGVAASKAGVAKTGIAEVISALGAQTGAAVTEGMPEPVQDIARLLGGLTGSAAAIPKKPKTPSYDDVSNEAEAMWGRVQGSDTRLTKQGRDDLVQRFDDRFVNGSRSNQVSERNTPKAVGAIEDIRTLPDDAHIYEDIVDYRRATGNNVAGAVDPAERRLGVKMKSEVDDFLENIQPNQATGSDVQGTVENLRSANDATRRTANADLITDELDKAGRRAARSGRGGNTINVVRQNMDKILNSRKLRAGFSPEDIKAMEDIVNGTPTTNAMRLISSASPSTGALPMMANMGAAGGFGATGNPMFLAPGIIGEGAKVGAEAITQKQVKNLLSQVLNGGPLPKRQMGEGNKAIIAALLANSAGREAQ